MWYADNSSNSLVSGCTRRLVAGCIRIWGYSTSAKLYTCPSGPHRTVHQSVRGSGHVPAKFLRSIRSRGTLSAGQFAFRQIVRSERISPAIKFPSFVIIMWLEPWSIPANAYAKTAKERYSSRDWRREYGSTSVSKPYVLFPYSSVRGFKTGFVTYTKFAVWQYLWKKLNSKKCTRAVVPPSKFVTDR